MYTMQYHADSLDDNPDVYCLKPGGGGGLKPAGIPLNP